MANVCLTQRAHQWQPKEMILPKSTLVNNEFSCTYRSMGEGLSLRQWAPSRQLRHQRKALQQFTAYIYILREELGLLWLLCCLLSEEPLVCSPKPVLIFVRGSLGATSCESPPGDNHSCYYIIPGRQSSKRLTLPLKSTELDVAEHRGSSRYSGGWDRMTMSSKPAWPMQKDPSWRRQII